MNLNELLTYTTVTTVWLINNLNAPWSIKLFINAFHVLANRLRLFYNIVNVVSALTIVNG